jgi:RHS repeat-associated protein
MERMQVRLRLSLYLLAATSLGVALTVGCGSSDDRVSKSEPTANVALALSPCDPAAPFDPPAPAFTGTALIDSITFSQDGNTAYLAGKLPPDTNSQIYVATRNPATNQFGPLTVVSPGTVSTASSERTPSLSADGSRLYFGRYVSSGTRTQLMVSTFNSSTQVWNTPSFLTNLNQSDLHDQDPFFLSATNELFFAAEPTDGVRNLRVSPLVNGSHASAADVSFSINPPLPAEDEYRPVLSSDGRTLYFASTRPGIGLDTGGDIWIAKRSTIVPPNTPFGAFTNLWSLNTNRIEFPAGISNDGCTLYFASNRDTSNLNDYRLYQATRGPSVPKIVSTTMKIVGSGSVVTAGYQCSSTCVLQGEPDSTVVLAASAPAIWSGSCPANASNPNQDGTLVFTRNGVCTVTFPNGSPQPQGGGCTSPSGCQPGLQCTLNACRCPPGSTACTCTPDCAGKSYGDDNGCGAPCNCDTAAPFDAPIPAFTGTMNADGLTFSADRRTAYVSGVGTNGYDIFVATRASLTAPFNTPTLVQGGINGPGDQRAPTLSPDGSRLYYTHAPSSFRDIAFSVRQPNGHFDAPHAMNSGFNSGVHDQDPFWWANGSLLLFASERPSGEQREIYQASGVNGGSYASLLKLAETTVNSPFEDFRPILSPDGLTLYFASKRGGIGGDTDGDVWMTKRTSPTAQFPVPVNVWSMNSSGAEFPVYVTPDGCSLYFASNEEMGLANVDNYRLYESKRGASTPASVAVTFNVIGTGTITNPPLNCSPGMVGQCSISGTPGSTTIVVASGQAQWTGICTANGSSTASSDGVVAFAKNGVCTIKFPDGQLVGPGGACSLTTDCQQGLECAGNVCACVPGGTCSASCRCGVGATGCDEDADCEQGLFCGNGTCHEQGTCLDDVDCGQGLICASNAGARFGKSRDAKICVDPTCAVDPQILGCGYVGAPCGSCEKGVPCDTDAVCPSGEVCGIGKGPAFGLSFANVCMKAECRADPVAAGCGTTSSPCGKCDCTQSCDSKQCGDDPSDGCGGRCVGFCDLREAGCQADADCKSGDACVMGGGPRIGLPAGTNVCLPELCVDPNPKRRQCGSASAECGTCAPPPGDACADRECGEDPAYGVSCGDCGGGLACVGGRCAPAFTVDSLRLRSRDRRSTDPNIAPILIEPIPVANLGTEVVPGALAGSFDVNQRGNATYTIPIEVPPGRAGIEPRISLRYNSATPPGLLGVGWSIGGMSSITRCPTIARRSRHRWVEPVRYDDNDRICLDGNPLVLVSGTNLQAGARYHTESDSFDQIRVSEDGDGLLRFDVYKRDGRIFLYGGTPSSLLYRSFGSGPPLIRAWALSKIVDRVGNFAEFRYGKLENSEARTLDANGTYQTVEFWPDEIAYGGVENPRGTVRAMRSVKFRYSENRDDYYEGFTRGGARIVRTKLLDRVETHVGGTPVRTYRLAYENAPLGSPIPSGRRGIARLTEVKECGLKHGFTSCKRPTTFAYENGQGLLKDSANPDQARVQFSSVRPLGNGTAPSPLIVLDFNGDGRDDLLSRLDGTWSLSVSTGAREVGEEPYAAVNTGISAATNGTGRGACLSQATVFDFDSDGRDDLFDVCQGYSATAGPVAGQIRIWRSTGDAASPFEAIGIDDPDFSPDELVLSRDYLVDLNGDGKKDLFRCTGLGTGVNDEVRFHFGTASGFESAVLGRVAAAGSCVHSRTFATDEDPIVIGDVDGDGAEDILKWTPTNWMRYVTYPDGGGGRTGGWIVQEGIPADIDDEVRNGLTRFVDVNGDGLKDLYVLRDTRIPTLYTNLGGRFDQGHVAYESPERPLFENEIDLIQGFTRAFAYGVRSSLVLDYNGDGREDLIRMFERRSGEAATLASIWQFDRGITGRAWDSAAGLDWLVADDAVAVAASSLPASRFLFQPQPRVLPLQVPVLDPQGQVQGRYPVSVLADADGDGSQDLLQVAEDGRLAISHGLFGHEHLVSRITDGVGKRIQVYYEPSNVFSGGPRRTYEPAVPCGDGPFTGGLRATTRCVRSRGPLVSRYQVLARRKPDVYAVDRSYFLRYEGAREGYHGLGWLGYDRRVVDERAPDFGIVKHTEILQDNTKWDETDSRFPFAGLERRRITASSFARSEIESEPVRRVVTRDNTWRLALSAAGVPFPKLDQSIEVTEDETAPGGRTLVATETTSYEVDGYGNVTLKSTTVQDGSGDAVAERTVETNFDLAGSRIGAWLVSLPNFVVVRDQKFNGGHTPSQRRETEMTYDGIGLLTTVTREPNANSLRLSERRTTTYVRGSDPFYSVESVTTTGSWNDENGDIVTGTRLSTVEFDADNVERIFPNRVTRHVGGRSLITEMRFDPRDGTMLGRVDPAGVGERWSYDPFGRTLSHESASDDVVTYYQDSVDDEDEILAVYPTTRVVALSRKTGATEARRFDALGRVTQSEETGLDGERVLTEYQYLFGQRLSAVSRPHVEGETNQGVVTMEYDERFRLRARNFPDGTRQRFASASSASVAAGIAPEAGETFVSAFFNQRGNRKVTFEDARGNALRTLDALGHSTRYEYEAFDRVGRITDSEGNETTIWNDRWGRMTRFDDADGGERTLTYTAFDQPLTDTDALGRLTRNDYDEVGRLVMLTTSQAGESDRVTDFFYDGPADQNALGRPTASMSPTGQGTAYTYEAPPASYDPIANRGYLASVEQHVSNTLQGGEVFTTEFSYNSKGQLESVEYPPSVADTDDEPSNAERFVVHYGYDSANHVTCVSDSAVVGGACGPGSFWRWDEAEQGRRLKKESFGNGVSTDYDYEDVTGRLKSIVTAHGATTYQDLEYETYDPNGNLTFRTQTFKNANSPGNTVVQQRFVYDALDRLDLVMGRDLAAGGAEFTELDPEYDALGNIESMNGLDYSYVPNSASEQLGPHALRRLERDGSAVTTYAYDSVGNVVERRGEGVTGTVQAFEYTPFNLPEKVTLGEGVGSREIRYEYDASRKRVLQSFADGSEERIYVGEGYERLASTSPGAAPLTHIYKIFAPGRQIAQVERESGGGAEQRRYLHADHLGSSQVVTDGTGALVHVQRFGAFGRAVNPAVTSTDAPASRIRAGFTGHESDAETGLVNMRGRLYDPLTARFLQADPFVFAGSSQTLNRYSYVVNNPLRFTDPSGFTPEDPTSDPEEGTDTLTDDETEEMEILEDVPVISLSETEPPDESGGVCSESGEEETEEPDPTPSDEDFGPPPPEEGEPDEEDQNQEPELDDNASQGEGEQANDGLKSDASMTPVVPPDLFPFELAPLDEPNLPDFLGPFNVGGSPGTLTLAVPAPPPTVAPPSGYLDLNLTLTPFTIGLLMPSGGGLNHVYLGLSTGAPGIGLSHAPSGSVSPGLSGQGQVNVGPFAGAVGVDQHGTISGQYGAALSSTTSLFGVSGSVYYTIVR